MRDCLTFETGSAPRSRCRPSEIPKDRVGPVPRVLPPHHPSWPPAEPWNKWLPLPLPSSLRVSCFLKRGRCLPPKEYIAEAGLLGTVVHEEVYLGMGEPY